MLRLLWGLLLLGGMCFWMTGTDRVRAQSTKKKTGPVVTIDGLKSQTFDYWKQGKPVKPELYHFNFPALPTDKVKEGPELTIVPISGNDDDTLEQQKKQIYVPEGKKLDQKVTKFKAGNASITQLELYGTYLQKDKPTDPDDKAKKRDRFRLVAVIFEAKGNKHLIRLVGSSPTVGQILPDLGDWLKNFK